MIGSWLTSAGSGMGKLCKDEINEALKKHKRILPILVDALRFFADLKIIQIPKYSSQGDFLATHEINLMTRIKAADSF